MWSAQSTRLRTETKNQRRRSGRIYSFISKHEKFELDNDFVQSMQVQSCSPKILKKKLLLTLSVILIEIQDL